MRGTIIGFDQMRGEGVVSDDAGNRYNFYVSSWRAPGGPPVSGSVVDFQAEGGTALDIFPAGGGPAPGPGPGPGYGAGPGYGPGPGGYGPGPGYGPGGYGGPVPNAAAQSALTSGIIALVCALVSMFLSLFLGPFSIITVIPGIIFGMKAVKLGKNLPDKTGYYLGLTGLILNIIGAVLCLLGFVFGAVLIGMLGAAGGFN